MGDHAEQLGEMAFTYRWYEGFLRRLRDAGYEFRRFGDGVEDGSVLLRHDVDMSLESAVRMADLEADLGVQSTYFVLVGSALYNPFDARERERLQRLSELGHDVALHFSTHEYWTEEPTESALERRVEQERAALDTVLPEVGEPVSFHVPPEWAVGRSFGFPSAYAPRYFTDMAYVADSGQRWREDPPDPDALPDRVQVLAHPGLWSESDDDFEACVERAIARSCRDASRKARLEILDGVPAHV